MLTSIGMRLKMSVVTAAVAVTGLVVSAPPAQAASAGTLDPSFGTAGKVIIPPGNPGAQAGDDIFDIAVQTDGKIVVVGDIYNGANYDFAVRRFNVDGTPDASFGAGGFVATDFAISDDLAFAVAIQADGKIVVAGSVGADFGLARYTTNGTLDNSFGFFGIGLVATPIGASDDGATAIAIQSDQKIVVGGYSYSGTTNDFALARYDTGGILDPTFDTDGIVTTPVGPGDDQLNGLVVQADQKIVAVGHTYSGTDYDFAAVRYDTGGTPDAGFGTGGKVTTGFGAGNDFASSVAVQTDQKIVVAGSSDNGTNFDFAVVRYDTGGTPDAGFGTGGKVTTPVGSGSDSANGVAVQADQRIVVSGTSSNGTDGDFALVRYDTGGGTDATFGSGGKVTTAMGPGDDRGYDLAIQGDGQIVVGGYASNDVNEFDFALARYRAEATTSTALSIKAPKAVTKGAKAKISGSLSSTDSSCTDAEQVLLLKGNATVGTTKPTGATGAYAFRVKVTRKTKFHVTYAGSAACDPSASLTKTVKVT